MLKAYNGPNIAEGVSFARDARRRLVEEPDPPAVPLWLVAVIGFMTSAGIVYGVQILGIANGW